MVVQTWADESIAEWERTHDTEPFARIMAEIELPYQRLPNGVLFRDRRRAHA